ncbi:MAG: SRPBCC family protein [Mycobacteriaceae bacterium]
MRVERRLIINADRDAIWKVVSNPDCYPSFMPNLERWETLTEGPPGVESRYEVRWKIGSMPVGGIVEVVEFDVGRDLAWVAITGVTQHGRFRLRDAGLDGTQVTFRLSYQAPGGLLGLIADRIASRQVGRELADTLKGLRKLVED